MNTSIISSARQGLYSHPIRNRGLAQRSSEQMDLSAMIQAEQKLASKQKTMAAMFEATAQSSNANQRSHRSNHQAQMQ